MKRFEKKTHYKMYKTHKGWLVAGVTVTTMAMGIFAGPQAVQTAQADTTPQTESTSESSAEQSSEVTLPKTQANKETGNNAAGTSTPETPEPDTGTSSATGTDAQSDGTGSGATKGATTGTPDTSTVGADGNVTPSSDKVASATTDKSSQPVVEDAALDDAASTTKDNTGVTVNPGVSVTDESKLTNKITGQPTFSINKTNSLQYTYKHVSTDPNGVKINSDLRLHDRYLENYQTQGAEVWQGTTKANSIAQDAKGVDPQTNAMYIDEWLPDYALQTVLWEGNFKSQYATIDAFRAGFTKAQLNTMTSFGGDDKLQYTGTYDNPKPTTYYFAMMAMQTLEGMQNATNLETVDLAPNVNVNAAQFGDYLKQGNLWDIRALATDEKLSKVSIQLFSVNDISALANKKDLKTVSLAYNQIADISPLATDNLSSKPGLNHQHILLEPITLRDNLEKGQNVTADGTIGYTTPSFIIKDLQDANLPIQGFDKKQSEYYSSPYPSSADAGNLNSNTVTWYNLLADQGGNYGSLSTTWTDPNSDFGGWILQPYALDEQASNLVVNVQLLQADGNQLTLGPSTVISGKIGDSVDINQNATVNSLISQTVSKGYDFTGLILDGTGLYSDYIAGNGKANRVASTVTSLTENPQNWTVLFAKDVQPWNVTTIYGYQTDDGTIHQITDENGTPVTGSFVGTSDNHITTASLQKDFPDYVYQGTYSSIDNQHWYDASADTNIPFIGAKQTILVKYAQAKRATVLVKDATTGQTLQTLDYTNTPSLRGAIGTTSGFDSASVTTPALQNGYVIVSDTTKQADGTSAITFAATNAANTDYTITLAHGFKTTQKAVNETITYQDLTQTPVQPATTHQAVFATVTDQVTKDAVTYSQLDPQTTLTPDAISGQPTDKRWTVYPADSAVTLAAVANPTIANMHVVATTDPAGKLTEIAAQAVTPDSQDLAFTVTYAHDFTTTTKQVTEGITYLDQTGKPVADRVNQTLTFATVTDDKTGQQTVYNALGAAQTPVLDDNGQPIDAAWTTGGQATFAAVTNPTVTGMHVVTTTDPAQDLTQTTAKQVTPDGQNLAFTVTYAHEFTTTAKQVTEGITYVDQAGQVVADPVTQTFTFVTVTDQSNQHQVTYSTPADTSTPALDSQGVPTGLDWTTYQTGDQLTFAAVKNPAVTGMHVVGTTDPAKDLTQITVQTVTSDGPDRTFTLTYAHDFKTTLNQVTEGITYIDQAGKSVANPVTKTITFATVTDQSNQKQTVYSTPAVAQTPTLDDNGVPTDQQTWTVYQAGDQLTFAAVTNPKVTGMHVVATTDPARDLTQTTAQAVTNASPNLTFVVTYDADATTGGGGDTGDNGGDDNNGGGTTTNPGDNNGGGTTTNPGDNGNGGDSGNNGGNTVTPPTTAPTIDGNGNDGDQGVPLKPAKKPAQLVTAGDANLASGGTPVKGSTAQPDGTTTLAAHGQADKGQVMTAAKATTTTLPQTSEQPQNSLAVLGLTLLGALAGLVGLKKHQN